MLSCNILAYKELKLALKIPCEKSKLEPNVQTSSVLKFCGLVSPKSRDQEERHQITPWATNEVITSWAVTLKWSSLITIKKSFLHFLASGKVAARSHWLSFASTHFKLKNKHIHKLNSFAEGRKFR